MYEELIQDLRGKAEFLREANRDSSTHNSFAETMSKAADAIEKLRSFIGAEDTERTEAYPPKEEA